MYLFDSVSFRLSSAPAASKSAWRPASGVREAQWAAASLHPSNANHVFTLTAEQRHLLTLFGA